MSITHLSGPLGIGNGQGVAGQGATPTYTGLFQLFGVQPAVEGGVNTVPIYYFGKGLANNTATSICTFTVPNGNNSAVYMVLVRAAINNSSHTYDSTRVVMYLLTLTRVSGANLVGGISAAIGAQIATVSGGQTLTATGGLSSVTGGVTATNTIDFQMTDVNGAAGTTEVSCVVLGINALASGVTVAQA